MPASIAMPVLLALFFAAMLFVFVGPARFR